MPHERCIGWAAAALALLLLTASLPAAAATLEVGAGKKYAAPSDAAAAAVNAGVLRASEADQLVKEARDSEPF